MTIAVLLRNLLRITQNRVLQAEKQGGSQGQEGGENREKDQEKTSVNGIAANF